MSRTKKGGKGPGFDYWSRRPKSSMGFGKWIKQVCNRIERRLNKKLVRKGDDLPSKQGIGTGSN